MLACFHFQPQTLCSPAFIRMADSKVSAVAKVSESEIFKPLDSETVQIPEHHQCYRVTNSARIASFSQETKEALEKVKVNISQKAEELFNLRVELAQHEKVLEILESKQHEVRMREAWESGLRVRSERAWEIGLEPQDLDACAQLFQQRPPMPN